MSNIDIESFLRQNNEIFNEFDNKGISEGAKETFRIVSQNLNAINKDILIINNNILMYVLSYITVLSSPKFKLEMPGIPLQPPYETITQNTGDDLNDDGLGDTVVNYQLKPYNDDQLIPNTSTKILDSFSLIISDIYDFFKQNQIVNDLNAAQLKSATIPIIGKYFNLSGEIYFNAINLMSDMSLLKSRGQDSSQNVPKISLKQYIEEYAGEVSNNINPNLILLLETIISPILSKSFTKPPLPPLPLEPLLLASMNDILDALSMGHKNSQKIDELQQHSASTIAETLSIMSLNYSQFLTGLSVDITNNIIMRLTIGSAQLLGSPPVFPPPLPIIVSPQALKSIGKFSSPMDKAILAWAVAHVPDADLRLGGIKPKVSKF